MQIQKRCKLKKKTVLQKEQTNASTQNELQSRKQSQKACAEEKLDLLVICHITIKLSKVERTQIYDKETLLLCKLLAVTVTVTRQSLQL